MKHFLHGLTLLLFTLCIASFNAYSQGEANIWYFGTNAGLDFNSGAPVALTNGALVTSEGCSSISDASGNLLFYTDGTYAYNRNHQLMPNGSFLGGSSTSTQSAMIVPWPGNPDKYYIFTVANNSFGPFSYCIVDLTLQGGLGDVSFGPQALFSICTERVTAVKHANGTDIWVIAQKDNTNSYYAYLVTGAGLNTTPVITSIGPVLGPAGQSFLGTIKANSQGTKIATATCQLNTILMFDFNNATGQLSNLVQWPATYPYSYAVEFSPDGTRLYATTMDSPDSKIWQFDLSSGVPATIFASAIILATNPSVYHYGTLQLGPDGKMYVAKNFTNFVGVINDPNLLGLACNYVDNGVSLAGQMCNWGLPDFIVSFFIPTSFSFVNTCFGDSTFFTIFDTTGVATTNWDFGDPNSGAANTSTDEYPFHIFSDTGTYSVTLIYDKYGVIDTSIVSVYINPLPDVYLGNDTSICQGYLVTLDAGNAGSTYLWSTNATTQTIAVSTSGNYSVTVTSPAGCKASDDINVTVYPIPVAPTVSSNSPVCSGDTLLLTTGAVTGATYSWTGVSGFVSAQQNNTITNAVASMSGVYSLTVTVNGCTSPAGTTNVIVNQSPVPPVVGSNSPICDGTDINLTSQSSAGASYSWSGPFAFSSSQQNPTVTAASFSNAGVYSVFATMNGCTSPTSSVTVVVNANPTSVFSAPIQACTGENAFVQYTGTATNAATFVWNFNGGIPSANSGPGPISVYWTVPGTYTISLQVTENGCISNVTTHDVIVYPDPVPSFTASPTSACDSITVSFQNTSPAGNYFWTFGDGGTSTDVNPTHFYTNGVYDVTLTVTTPEGCAATLFMNDYIMVLPTPVADFTVSPDFYEMIELQFAQYHFTSLSIGATNYDWDFGDGAGSFEMNPTHEYMATGLYPVTLIAINALGCTDTITKYNIDVVPNSNYFIPTAFTPNGDGINDVLFVQGYNIMNVYLEIYDRWGEQVADIRDLGKGWDGTIKGVPANTGVYVYTGYVVMGTGKEYEVKGDVTLIR